MSIEEETTLDGLINLFFQPISETLASVIFYSVPVIDGVEVILMLVWMVVAAFFFTLYLGFPNFRYFSRAIKLTLFEEKTKGKKRPDGQISSFQALMTSMAATVGLGNIAGVAIAISLGGPGAAFWMVVMALFGMSLKFAEVMCGVQYRQHPDPERPERIAGGPMYYIMSAFEAINQPMAGKILSIAFGAFCALGALGAAPLFQTNQAYQQLLNVTGGELSFMADKGWLFGVFMLVITAVVIVGGIRSIASVSGKIVPVMAGLYMLMGLYVAAYHFFELPSALWMIVSSAFDAQAGFAALVGTLLTGIQRATFSNEAGLGSAAVSQSAVLTDCPVEQGFVGMLGPFIDTVIVCTITSLVIVLSGSYLDKDIVEGVALTSRAFGTVHNFFPYLLAMIVFMFAYSTIIGWYYIGFKGYSYIFGTKPWVENIYKAIFLIFIVIGASANLDAVILFTDSLVFAMAIPNIIALYLLAPSIKKDLLNYSQKLKAKA